MSVWVRRGELGDVDYLISQLKEFADFYGTKTNLFPNDEYAAKALSVFIQDHVVFVAEHDTAGPIGFIIGLVGPHQFRPDMKVLTEIFWWVQRDYRNTRAGFILFNEYLKWGKENVDWVTCSLEAKKPVRESFLTKRGFKHYETTYVLEIN